MDQAMNYVIANKGVNTYAAYGYVSGSGSNPKCNAALASTSAAAISSYSFISKSAAGETAMYDALPKVGPITIALDATPMQTYVGGISNPANCGAGGMINHAVTITGYGVENGVAFWKIKNSWGTSW